MKSLQVVMCLWCDAQQYDSHCESRASSRDSSDRDRSPVKKI